MSDVTPDPEAEPEGGIGVEKDESVEATQEDLEALANSKTEEDGIVVAEDEEAE